MIRYKKTVQIKRSLSGAYTITGDRMSVSYKTSAINGYEHIRIWWERQHHSTLREYQKNLLIQHIPQAFRAIDYEYELTPYVVFAEGAGYNQPHDLCFATLENADTRIYLLGTCEHTWIHTSDLRQERFALNIEDALGSAGTPKGRDELWSLYDGLRALEA